MGEHVTIWGWKRRWKAACALGAIACGMWASPAAANGRFPRAQRLILDQANPDVMALYGTYGLLVTRDAGASWRHVCEAATGAYAGEDSLLEIMADEHLVLRTDAGLARSDASFCSYDPVLGSSSAALQDITRDSASPNGILALTTALGDDGVFVSSLSSSADGGATFAPLASMPSDIIELGLTLDVASSDSDLIYISGFDALGRSKLAKSTDRGQSFSGSEITGLGVADPPYIAAVSALDPNRVFIRTDVFSRADNDFEARETANDSLYFTPDGGQTWHRALNKRGKLYGFALSPDEQWVLAGYGDPVLPAIFVEPDELGLYRVALADLVASPDAPPWERIYDKGVTCLRWTERGLFACVAQDQSGFELGRADDAGFSLAVAAPLEPLLRLPEVRPLECPAESAAAACLMEETTGWLATCNVLRAQCSLDAGDGEPNSPSEPRPGGGGSGDMPGDSMAPAPGSEASGGAGGISSAPSSAGAGASTASAGGDGTGQPGAAGSQRSSGSCSAIATARGARGYSPAWWLVALLLLAARRRASGPLPPRAALVASLPLAASSLGGCSDEANPDAAGAGARDVAASAAPDAASTDCGGAGEDFVLGMSKTTPDGALTVAIVTAEPAPPLVGPNSWIVQLSRENGEAITDANVSFNGWMPQHGHGLSAVPLTTELDGGRYDIQPIILFMPQLWELSVVVTQNEEREVATFDFCVR